MKEQHPCNLSLYDLVSGSEESDNVFVGLQKYFSADFLMLKSQEHASIMMRYVEYKDLTKKAILLTYMLLNLSPVKTRELMTT